MGRSSEEGFSLAELTIATVVLLLVMLIANQLLLESQRIFLRSAAEMRNPVISVAVAQLREDFQAASRVRSFFQRWSVDRLDLLGHPSGWLRYERVGGNLERIVFSSDGTIGGQRTLLRDVTTWRWRQPVPGLLDLEIGVRMVATPEGTQMLAPPMRQTGQRVETRFLRFALRGGGGQRRAW